MELELRILEFVLRDSYCLSAAWGGLVGPPYCRMNVSSGEALARASQAKGLAC